MSTWSGFNGTRASQVQRSLSGPEESQRFMMRTAKSSALVAAFCVLGCLAQEPQRSKPAEPAATQPKPIPAKEAQPPAGAAATDPSARPAPPAPADVDPTKMAAAPAAGGNPKPPSAAPVDVKSYKLGAEDVIFISVWRSAEFSGQHMIRPDG